MYNHCGKRWIHSYKILLDINSNNTHVILEYDQKDLNKNTSNFIHNNSNWKECKSLSNSKWLNDVGIFIQKNTSYQVQGMKKNTDESQRKTMLSQRKLTEHFIFCTIIWISRINKINIVEKIKTVCLWKLEAGI